MGALHPWTQDWVSKQMLNQWVLRHCIMLQIPRPDPWTPMWLPCGHSAFPHPTQLWSHTLKPVPHLKPLALCSGYCSRFPASRPYWNLFSLLLQTLQWLFITFITKRQGLFIVICPFLLLSYLLCSGQTNLLLLLNHDKPVPTSGPLNLLFLPGMHVSYLKS